MSLKDFILRLLSKKIFTALSINLKTKSYNKQITFQSTLIIIQLNNLLIQNFYSMLDLLRLITLVEALCVKNISINSVLIF